MADRRSVSEGGAVTSVNEFGRGDVNKLEQEGAATSYVPADRLSHDVILTTWRLSNQKRPEPRLVRASRLGCVAAKGIHPRSRPPRDPEQRGLSTGVFTEKSCFWFSALYVYMRSGGGGGIILINSIYKRSRV